jgi:hypothetical protein
MILKYGNEVYEKMTKWNNNLIDPKGLQTGTDDTDPANGISPTYLGG